MNNFDVVVVVVVCCCLLLLLLLLLFFCSVNEKFKYCLRRSLV